MRFFLTLFLVLVYFPLSAQQIISRLPLQINDHRVLDGNEWESAIANDAPKEKSGIFFQDASDFYALLLKNDSLTNSLKFKRLPKPEFSSLLGAWINNEGCGILFADESKDRFASLNIDTSLQKVTQHVYDIELENEQYINSFAYRGKYYIVTTIKLSDAIVLYTFDKANQYSRHELKFRSYPVKGKAVKFSTLLGAYVDYRNKPVIIEEGRSYAYQQMNSKNKFLVEDGKLFILLSEIVNGTEILTVDLDTYKRGVLRFDEPEFKYDTRSNKRKHRVNKNLFLQNGKLTQALLSKEEVAFNIVDIESGKVLKSWNMKNEIHEMEAFPALSYEKRVLWDYYYPKLDNNYPDLNYNYQNWDSDWYTFYIEKINNDKLLQVKAEYAKYLKKTFNRLNQTYQHLVVNEYPEGTFTVTLGSNYIYTGTPNASGPPVALFTSMDFVLKEPKMRLLNERIRLPFAALGAYQKSFPDYARSRELHQIIRFDKQNNIIYGTYDKKKEEYKIIKFLGEADDSL